MSRYILRSLVPLLFVVAFSVVAKADSFAITFTQSNGTVAGTGQFTTNGLCALCTLTAGSLPGGLGDGGLLTFTASIANDTGASAFDIIDDIGFAVGLSYNRATNLFDSPGATNSETGDFLLVLSNGNWSFSGPLTLTGTYTITPIGAPEPSTLLLLLSGMIGLVAVATRGCFAKSL